MRRSPRRLGQPLPRLLRSLAVLGRNSLVYYMLHQPVMIGLVLGYGWLMR
jgi:uncharacterized membrane protein